MQETSDLSNPIQQIHNIVSQKHHLDAYLDNILIIFILNSFALEQ